MYPYNVTVFGIHWYIAQVFHPSNGGGYLIWFIVTPPAALRPSIRPITNASYTNSGLATHSTMIQGTNEYISGY